MWNQLVNRGFLGAEQVVHRSVHGDGALPLLGSKHHNFDHQRFEVGDRGFVMLLLRYELYEPQLHLDSGERPVGKLALCIQQVCGLFCIFLRKHPLQIPNSIDCNHSFGVHGWEEVFNILKVGALASQTLQDELHQKQFHSAVHQWHTKPSQ